MAIKDITENAKKELAGLTGFKSPSAVGIKKEGKNYIVTVEMLEKTSIPDGMDILGTYEVEVSEGGNMLGYKRIGLRKRTDTGTEGGEE